MWRNDSLILENIYLELLEEGLEEKIPKLLAMVRPEIDNKEGYIREVAQTFDPTPQANYITWILKMLKMGVFRGEEDADKCRETLAAFTKLKNVPTFPKDKKDLNTYKNYGDLAEIVAQYSDIKSKKEVVRAAREEGINLVEESPPFKLYIVTLPEAAAKHFRDTQWCVKDPRHFDNYGPPYYYFTKDDEPYKLLHLDSSQLMDLNDRPTNLGYKLQGMMETEEMTKYVMEHDKSDDALQFYGEKVGGGYDNLIGDIAEKKIDELVSQYNLEYLDINIEGSGDELYISAYGFMPYDFGDIDIEDRAVAKIVEEVLGDVDIYVSDLEYSDALQEDGVRFSIDYNEQDDYNSRSKIDKVRSFLDDLADIDEHWESKVEKFKDNLTEKLIKGGYISSGYSTFLNKALPLANFTHFKDVHRDERLRNDNKKHTNLYISDPVIDLDVDGMKHNFIARDFSYCNPYFGRLESPIDLMAKFLVPITGDDIRWGMNHQGSFGFRYEPIYDEDTSTEEYMSDFKKALSIDRHWDEYATQIQAFWMKYVRPYFENYDDSSGYNIPQDIKLPLLKTYGRKEDRSQQQFDFHEKTSFEFLLTRLTLITK